MYILREAKESDHQGLLALAKVGIISLPPEPEELLKKIQLSVSSFKKNPDRPGNEYYLFVLEELETGCIVGTSAIRATAPMIPKFRKRVEPLPSVGIPHPASTVLLKLKTEQSDASELCGIVLDETIQSKGLGHLLSKGRLLFIADHLTRFHDVIVADLRGVIRPDGICPFWEEIGKTFCPLSYPEVEHLYRVKPEELFSLLPRHSLYLSRLPKEVQEVIGKTHEKTTPALKMLLKEGFHLTDEIDPLDGGPRVEAALLEIKTLKEGKIGLLSDEEPSNPFPALISRTQAPFRACIEEMAELPSGKIALSAGAKKGLETESSPYVRYKRLRHD